VKRLAAIMVLLCALPLFAQEKGLKAGFRDLKWRDPVPQSMTKDVDEGVVMYYVRADCPSARPI
jgi:hypothetical protein